MEGKEQKEPNVEEGEQATRLHASDFTQLIEEKKAQHYHGTRGWMFDSIRAWLHHPDKRLYWLAGGAGTGKSVVSAKLFDESGIKEHIVAWHFCRHDNAAGSDVRVILQSWAAMLSTNLPGFNVKPEEITKGIAGKDEDMFENLLAAPLRRTPAPSHPKVIVLDALDELPKTSLNPILFLITDVFKSLPPFIRLFVTSRDERAINARLNVFDQEKLEVDEVRNRADLRMYLAEVARKHIKLELTVADVEAQMEKQLGLAQGSLHDKLGGVETLIRKSKNIYETVVNKVRDEPAYKKICSVGEIRPNPSPAQQIESNFDVLYADAAEAREQLLGVFASEWEVWKTVDHGRTVLRRPVKGKQASWVDNVIDPGLKSKESASRKVTTDYKGDASNLKDLTRFTAECETCDRMSIMLYNLCSNPQLQVIGLRNKYANATPLGYRDFNLTVKVKLPNNRVHICELQVNVQDMLQAKELAHELYEVVRVQIPYICRLVGANEAKFEQSLIKLLRSSVLETAVRQLEQNAGGLFLYATLLALELERQPTLEFSQIQGLPAGLGEVYKTNFDRMVGPNKSEWPALQRVIALISASRQPLPVVFVQKVIGPESAVLEQTLSLLFPVRQGRFQVMHKSVVDWLKDTERKDQEYSISPQIIAAAHAELAPQLLKWCESRPLVEPFDAETSFALAEVIFHLGSARMIAEVHDIVTKNLPLLLARVRMAPSALASDLEQFAERDPIFGLVASTLRLDIAQLNADPLILPALLVSRLLAYDGVDTGVTELLRTVRAWPGPSHGNGWWCPMQQTFQPVGSQLQLDIRQPDHLQSVEWSPDCNFIAVAYAKELRVWEMRTGRCGMILTGHTDGIHVVRWSPDGSRLCSGSSDKTVRLWDIESATCMQVLKGDIRVNSLTWSPDGLRICTDDKLWEVDTGRCLRANVFTASFDSTRVQWSKDGSMISSAQKNKIQIWEPEHGVISQTLSTRDFVRALEWSNDGRLCSACDDGVVQVWDPKTGNCSMKAKLRNNQNEIHGSASWNFDGSKICVGVKHAVVILDAKSGEILQNLTGHTNIVTSVNWNKKGKICSGSWDFTLKVWDPSANTNVKPFAAHTGLIYGYSWSGDGQLVTGSGDKTVKVWDIERGEVTKTIDVPGVVFAVAWSSDGRIASGGWDLIRVWDPKSGECMQMFEGGGAVSTLSWSSDGRIASGGQEDNSEVRLWDVETGELTQELTENSYNVSSVMWSADCKYICSSSFDKAVRVWEDREGQFTILHQFPFTHNVGAASWSADNKVVATCEANRTRVFDIEKGTCIYESDTLAGYQGVPFWIEYWPAASQFVAPTHSQSLGPGWYPAVHPLNPQRAVVQRGNSLHPLKLMGKPAADPLPRSPVDPNRCHHCTQPFQPAPEASLPSNVILESDVEALQKAMQRMEAKTDGGEGEDGGEDGGEDEGQDEASARGELCRLRGKPFTRGPNEDQFTCKFCNGHFCQNCLLAWEKQYRGHCGACVAKWLHARLYPNP